MKLLILIFIIFLINFIFTNILIINLINAQISRESIENTINDTTIKAISNSLNDTTNRLITSMIQSINSSALKTIDQSDYATLSAYTASG